MMKVRGGLSGIILKPEALAKLFLAAPEMTRLSEEVMGMANTSSTQRRHKHHELSPAVIKRQMRHVQQLQTVVVENNPFKQDDVTGAVMPQKVQDDILKSEETGQKCYLEFVEKRILGPASPWDKMTRLNLMTWKSASKTTKVKLANKVVELKENRSLFAQILIIGRSRPDVDLQSALGVYEFSCIPRSLFSSDGSLLTCFDKHKLMAILEAPTQEENGPQYFSAIHQDDEDVELGQKTLIIDGMVIVQELSSLSVKTCKEFAQHFVRRVQYLAVQYQDVHVVFDRYDVEHTLKKATRQHRYGQNVDAFHFAVGDATQIKVPLKKPTVECGQHSDDQMADVSNITSRSGEVATDTSFSEESYTQSSLPGTNLIERHGCVACSTIASRIRLDSLGSLIIVDSTLYNI